MSPRTGRPPKGKESKSVSLQIQIAPGMATKLEHCANSLGITRTEVIEKGITLVEKTIESQTK